jgi:hypothetical protein
MRSLRRTEVCAALAVGLLFLVPLLIWGPFDHEETPLGIFSTQVHMQHLARGEWLYWLNDLGFGTPLPIGHRLDFHPAFALAAVGPLRLALRALWLLQVALAALYFLRLAAVSGIRPPLRLTLLACYLFSAASVCWFYENDWVTFVVALTTYPMLLFYLRQAVLGEADTNFWLAAVRLALLFGFVILNSHPGYIVPLVVVLAVYVLAAAPPRVRVYACLAVAAILCLAVCSERVYFFADEMRFFPADFRKYTQPGYQLTEYLEAAILPLTPAVRAAISSGSDVRAAYLATDGAMRLPFIGLVLGLAACISVVQLRRATDPHVRACSVAFAAALLFSFGSIGSLFRASGGWLFRDPMLLFGFLAGGVVLQRAISSPHAVRRRLAWALVGVQVLQQASAVSPGFRQYYQHRDVLHFYRYQGQAMGIGRMLVQHAAAFGPRVYLSAEAQLLARAYLSDYGIHVVTDLTFLGLNPVNAWFKVVSMGRLYPPLGLWHGYIGGERDVIENASLLDTLGVNMILTTEAEGPVPEGLQVLERLPVTTLLGDHVLLVLGNPDAWPKAVLLDPGASSVSLPKRPACPNEAALCRDYRTMAEARLPDPLSVTADNGRYTVRVTPATRPRLLFLSTLYRPEWVAASPRGALAVTPVAGAFLGVLIPAGTEEVRLWFSPTGRILLTWLSGLTLLALLAGLGVMSWTARARARRGGRSRGAVHGNESRAAV